MNFDDEVSEVDLENKRKMKKILIIIVSIMVVLLCLAGGIYLYAQNEQNKGNKFASLNSKRNDEILACFIVDNGKTYANIEKIGPILKYKFRRGEYGKNNEDRDYCYLENEFEVIEFHNGSDVIKKYTVSEKNLQPQEFNIGTTVKLLNETLYLPEDGFKYGLGVKFEHQYAQERQNESFIVYTAEYLSKQAETVYEFITISEDTVSFDREFVYFNEKAVLDNLYVVDERIQETKTNKPSKNEVDESQKEEYLHGVVKIEENKTTKVISPHYKEIKYLEGTKDFWCKDERDRVGIINSSGETKIDFKYDSIKLIDVANGLYLVTSDSKQGIVNSDGKVIVYQNYDQIGLDEVKDSNVTNRYVLYGKIIPVKRDDKWQLINTEGFELTQLEFDGVGCFETNIQGASSEGVVLIPELNQGIVLEKDSIQKAKKDGKEEDVVTKFYGVVDINAKEIVVFRATAIFKTITRDVTSYYCLAAGDDNKIDLVAEFKKYMAGEQTYQIKNTVSEDNTVDDSILNNNEVVESNNNNNNNNNQNNNQNNNNQTNNNQNSNNNNEIENLNLNQNNNNNNNNQNKNNNNR